MKGAAMIANIIDRFFIKQPRLRRLVTRLVYGNRLTSVSLFGSTVHLHTLRENGYLRTTNAAKHLSFIRDEAPVLLTLANVISDNCAFVDVGANVGVYSCLVSRFTRIHSNLKIFAFEVHPDTYLRLAHNAASHSFQAFNVGIGARKERAQFVDGAVSHVTTRAEFANAYSISSNAFFADIKPLVDFELDFDGLDLIVKIDVEGQELAVLDGARAFFEQDRIRAVYIDGYSDKKCWDFLEGYGLRLFDGRTLEVARRDTFSLLALRPLRGEAV